MARERYYYSSYFSKCFYGQLEQECWDADIVRILKETGLEPKYLRLKITESRPMQENSYVLPNIMNIKQLGVSLAPDDFGTGFSSMCYLKKFGVKYNKNRSNIY
ncbi:EAL domain-containing protein [Paenibacillus silviterrae]|uniref:EAL domain-containing protein n=1 Tax=Paenibacillus silviterrae TaxID=3242194 RepID=UPI00254282BE|nr:EAL domain-containing protein [Paenibacillus chinjuensis]